MPYWTPPIVKSWSMNGVLPSTKPDRVDNPSPNLTADDVGEPPDWPSGAYQRPSRSSRWKLPVPPRGPPLCDRPIECIVPAVANGKSMRVSRMTDAPMVERRQLLQLRLARPVVAPVNDWTSTE